MPPASSVTPRPDAIAAARRTAGLSLRAVADAALVSHGTVHNIERGRAGIARDKAERVAAALSCAVDDLFQHADGASLNVPPARCDAVVFRGSLDPDSASFGPDEYCDADAEPGSDRCARHVGQED